MKFTLLFILLTCIVTNGFAKIHTVSNNPDRPAQFTQVNPAINAASAGDSIYVYGSLTNYNDFTITKRLKSLGKNSRTAVVVSNATAHSGCQRGQSGNKLGSLEK